MSPTEIFYLFIVIVLFVLAISDLVVGVGNDAVNFLTGAIGSKAADFRTIMWVATAGIIIGTTFSSGMMEIARNGIFYPDKFLFREVMIIFLAVMFTDVLLLDFFNTVGLPTSTTVSIIFELLGSAVMVAVLKTLAAGNDLAEVGSFINSASALGIMRGILVSVILAFAVGALIQYIARLVFTFDWEKTYKYFASVWGGLSISAITYFIIIKGAKGSTLISPEMADSINENTGLILLISFFGWTLVLELLSRLLKINILKIIVLFGTFALTMAFAGNDLVNFIGAPLAGYESYRLYLAHGSGNPDSLNMDALNHAIKSPAYFLVFAGIIMALTLWFSKKARTVTRTSVDLARQSDGNERFQPNILARLIVRAALLFGDLLSLVVPNQIRQNLDKRFKPKKSKLLKEKDKPAFDLVRGSVNLVVASALIALGTSLKLPLSTTYVTFMVAMGTSFTDKAWGRESAVYRVSGVITVIGGWFLTAIVAFTVSGIVASLLFYGSYFAIIGMILLSAFLLYRTHLFHAKAETKEKKQAEETTLVSFSEQVNKYNEQCANFILEVPESIATTFDCLTREKLNKSIKAQRKFKNTVKEIKLLRTTAPAILKRHDDLQAEAAYYYLQSVDQMKEIADTTIKLMQHVTNYLDNLHPTIHPDQAADLKNLAAHIKESIEKYTQLNQQNASNSPENFRSSLHSIHTEIEVANRSLIRLIRQDTISARNSLLFANILHETRNILNHMALLADSHQKYNQLLDKK